MAGFYSLENKEVIRIKVKKCDGMMQPEYKKFSIDPQITSFEMLQGILAKAFEIKSDFTLSYLARDAEGQEVYLSMLSDWDMDAAFQCAADPCLKLKVDLKPFDQELDDWDVIAPADIPQARISSLLDKNSLLGTITSNITSHMGKTMSSMQRAMGFRQTEDPCKPLKPPMSDMEFHNYLDSAGFMIKPTEFRLSIYQGGIEGSLRRVAWRHLLNIFPENMSGRERFDYLKRKEQEYYSLRDEWKERFAGGSTTEEVKHVASMVKKDVLRTDRNHRLYAGGDDNKNVLSLFHILVTYALTHPDVSYCQGMSDLASPLLVIQKEEAQAYICFCSLMSRIRGNFSPDGSSMMTQLRHLANLLQVHDLQFYEYLQTINAHDLFFCYRWLLLLLKREFPFEDALYMLEVMWSTLPPAPPESDLPLVDPDYNAKLLSASPCSPTFSFQQSIYAKLLAMRCSNKARDVGPASTSSNPASVPPSTLGPVHGLPTQTMTFDVSPADEDRADYPQIDDIMTRSLQQRSNSIDQVLQDCGSAASSNNLMVPPQEYNRPSRHCPQGSVSASLAHQKQSGGATLSAVNSFVSSSSSDSSDTCDGTTPDENNSTEEISSGDECPLLRAVEPKGKLLCDAKMCNKQEDIKENRCDCQENVESNADLGTVNGCLIKINPTDGSSLLPESDKDMQFSLSLDSNPSSPDVDKQSQSKKEGSGEDEGYSGFFGSMKKLLASPKRRPENIVIMREISSFHSTSNATPHVQDVGCVEEAMRRVHSDSGVSDGDGSGSWSSVQLTQRSKLQQAVSIILPPPQEFGNGNPFLMFLCLTLMLQHREQIMQLQMGYEEVAQFFNKMVRRHHVHKVLHQARELYTDYLRIQQQLAEQKASAGKEEGLSC